MASYWTPPAPSLGSRQFTPVRSTPFLGNIRLSQLTPTGARKEERLPHLRTLFSSAAVEKVRLRFCDRFCVYDTEDQMVDPQQIILSHQLAKGSYGTVYQGTYQGTQSVAIKVEDFPSGTEGQANLFAELSILKVLAHERVVQHMGTGYFPTPTGPKVSTQHVFSLRVLGFSRVRGD